MNLTLLFIEYGLNMIFFGESLSRFFELIRFTKNKIIFVTVIIILWGLQILLCFISYLAAPLPTLDHYQGDSVTHSIFCLYFFQCLTQTSTGASNQGWAPKLGWVSCGVWDRSFGICSECIHSLGHPAQRDTILKGLLPYVHSCRA